MRSCELKEPSWISYSAPLAALVAAVGAIKITGFDVWWQLLSGWVIVNLKSIPGNDIFSYTAFGAPWINHQWIFQAIQWLVFDYMGETGIILFKAAILGAIVIVLFRTVSFLTRSRNMAMWASVIFIFGTANRVMNRPFMAAMLLLAVYCLIIHKYSREGSKSIWLLPLLQVIWMNTHGGGLMGAIAIFAFAAGETIQSLVPEKAGGPTPLPRERITRLWIVGLACVAASLINPWGAEIFVYYRDLGRMPIMLRYTMEWMPLLHPRLDYIVPAHIYTLTIMAALASFFLNAKRARLSHLFLSAFMMLLMIRGHRFGPEMTIVLLPIAALNLSESIFAEKRASARLSWIGILVAFMIALLTFTFGVPISLKHRPDVRMGLGAPEFSAPVRMVDFLEYYNIRGRVFNDMGLGGYLLFRRWPGELVFFDGRTPVYGEEFFREYIEALMNQRNFEELLEKHDFDYLVLSTMELEKQRKFHEYLWNDPRWRLVYAMNDGFVYLRDVPRFKEPIKKLELKRHPLLERPEGEKGAAGETD